MNNLKSKIRISKDKLKFILENSKIYANYNKTILTTESNNFVVNDFDCSNMDDFYYKFDDMFKSKFNNDFDPLTMSEFIKTFNSEFVSNFKNETDKHNSPFNSDTNRAIDDNCSISDEEIDIYYSIDRKTSIGVFEVISDTYEIISLSKTAIKQYIFYHFIPSNASYVRKGVSYKEISNYCNISIPTVKANHKALEAFGLIESTASDYGKIDFIITDEYKLHKSKKEGGSGYITMPLDILNHLLKFHNINELKVELKKLLWVDAKSGSIGKNVKFNKNNLVSILPDYIKKSKKMLNKILNTNLTLFKVDKGSLNTLKYETKSDIDSRLISSLREKVISIFGLNNVAFNKKYFHLVSKLDYLKDNGYEFEIENTLYELELNKEATISSICQLIMQYGLNHVKKAIDFMFNDYCSFDEDLGISENEIKNPGAFIRTIIRNNINSCGSLITI